VALIIVLGQVAFTPIIGFGLALLLGMSATVALYVAVALTFSSTIIRGRHRCGPPRVHVGVTH
jgi:predicted Kef-type K+ transport protein